MLAYMKIVSIDVLITSGKGEELDGGKVTSSEFMQLFGYGLQRAASSTVMR